VIIEWKMNMTFFEQKHRTKEQCSFTGGYLSKNVGKHHRALTRFIFQSAIKRTQSSIVNQIAGISWANQFKFMYTKKGPPMKCFFDRVRDARLGLKIGADQYYGLKTDEFRWAIIYPPP
jgi:hypothetical protein